MTIVVSVVSVPAMLSSSSSLSEELELLLPAEESAAAFFGAIGGLDDFSFMKKKITSESINNYHKRKILIFLIKIELTSLLIKIYYRKVLRGDYGQEITMAWGDSTVSLFVRSGRHTYFLTSWS